VLKFTPRPFERRGIIVGTSRTGDRSVPTTCLNTAVKTVTLSQPETKFQPLVTHCYSSYVETCRFQTPIHTRRTAFYLSHIFVFA